MTQWLLKDAVAHFAEIFSAAKIAPQIITDGEITVTVQREDAQPAKTAVSKDPSKSTREYTFVDHLLAIPKGGPEDLFERRKPTRRDIDL